MFQRILFKIWRHLLPFRIHIKSYPLRKIGSGYGFSIVPQNWVNERSIVYSFGAGLDLHWDVEMAREFGCRVHIFDPTPQSVRHFEQLCDHTCHGKPFHSETGSDYKATPHIIQLLEYHEFALWNNNERLKFYLPGEEGFVSHSITQVYDRKGRFIEVEARTLSELMRQLNHTSIDFLKLDIEGAEYAVIDQILDQNLDIKAIYVEYHFDQNLSPPARVEQVVRSIRKLEKSGYQCIFQEASRYFTFIRRG